MIIVYNNNKAYYILLKLLKKWYDINNIWKYFIYLLNNNVVYNSKYGKLLFEADFLKMSIGPISIILDP